MSESNIFGTVAKSAAISHIATHVLTGTLCACGPVLLIGAAGGLAYHLLTTQACSKPDESVTRQPSEI